jgi:hypothetical protein
LAVEGKEHVKRGNRLKGSYLNHNDRGDHRDVIKGMGERLDLGKGEIARS